MKRGRKRMENIIRRIRGKRENLIEEKEHKREEKRTKAKNQRRRETWRMETVRGMMMRKHGLLPLLTVHYPSARASPSCLSLSVARPVCL